MRAAAACQFTFSRFGAWRVATLMLAGCVVAALGLWVVSQPIPLPAHALAGAVSAGIVALWLGVSAGRIETAVLRWDGSTWHLGPAQGQGVAGTLTVAVDFGAWMLLRFHADAAPRWAASAWLPVQRAGIDAPWHALRCAVYSPRLARDADTAAPL
jgi:hypothetical protein